MHLNVLTQTSLILQRESQERSNRNYESPRGNRIQSQNSNNENFSSEVLGLKEQSTQNERDSVKKSQAGRSEIAKQSTNSQGTPRMQGIMKKQSLLMKKFFEEKLKEMKLHGVEERVSELDREVGGLRDSVSALGKSCNEAISTMQQMKHNFDLITIHKKYFNALVEKPIKHADQIRASLVALITDLSNKHE